MRLTARLLLLAALLALTTGAEAASLRMYGTASASVPGCPLGTGLTDLNGEPDDCEDATQNPSFQDPDFFTTARQSGQTYDAATLASLNYNKSCIDNGCGYDTTVMNRDPKTVSFDSSNASITAGVLNVPADSLGIGGVPYVGQVLSGTGITANTVHITGNIDATNWQTDAPELTLGARAISGRLFTGLNCQFLMTLVSIYEAPVVNCPTNGDTTTGLDFNGFDMSMYGGTYLRIPVGAGGGSNGLAGPVRITNSKFTCNVDADAGGVSTAIGTHFDLYFEHNEIDSGYSDGCTTNGAGYNNLTTGLSIEDTRIHSFQWNHIHNQPKDNVAGGVNYTDHTVSHNAFIGINLANIDHSAVFANTQTFPMAGTTYKQNLCLMPSTSIEDSGTTCFSILGNGANYKDATQGRVTISGNIAISNLAGGVPGDYVVQNCLMANNDPVAYGELHIGGNLVDRTGCAGGSFQGGLSRNSITASVAANAGTGTSTVTVTNMNNDNWQQNAYVHVNNTPYTWTGSISDNGDGTGTMTIPAGHANLAAGNGVAGITVYPGTYIFSKTNNTTFIVKNYYGTTAEYLTAPSQGMYSTCSVLPHGTIDPATGSPSTGTGKNNGTYIIGCEGTDTSKSTWRRYNPAIGTFPPDVNKGTDIDLVSGSPLYMSGSDW